MSSPKTNARVGLEATVIKRKRPAACVHCHQRKVRCDARTVGLPCSNCRSAGRQECQIHEKRKRALVRSFLDPVPIRCGPLPTSKIQFGLGSPVPSPTRESSSRRPSHLITSHQSRPLSRSQLSPRELSYADSEIRSDQDDNRELERHLIKLIDQEDLEHRSIRKGVRVIYVGQDVSNINFLLRQQRSDRDDEVYHFAANEISKRYMKKGVEQIPVEAFELPEQSLADELVQAYFTHVNPGFPIIDEDMFMAQYQGRDPSDPPSLLILQTILLAGAHVSRSRLERDSLKAAFFRRAKILFEARVERDRDILVQAALLLTWHSDPVDDDVAANAHFWVGVAARIATGLGMHRNAGSSMLVPHDKRMWRRVWWILVQFDVMVSLLYGRPQAVNLDDCDVQPLTPPDFEGCGPRVQVDYVIHFTELCRMISVILRERFGLRVSRERRKAVLAEADKALASWSLMLPDALRMSSADMDYWPALLQLTYNNFLILLHRPHPRASAYSDDYGPNDAEICSAAAGVIVSIFEELRERDCIKYLWISSVNAIFTAMIQVRVELRFSNPVLAINALRRFDSTMCSLRKLAEYWLTAETILRVFETSKRLQRDMQVVKMKEPGRKSRNSEAHRKEADHAPPSVDQSAEPHLNAWPAGPQSGGRISLLNKPITASAEADLEQADQLKEHADWRQLFPFNDSEQAGSIAAEDFPDMEDEWRELYLNEPPMSDYFNDGSWMPEAISTS